MCRRTSLYFKSSVYLVVIKQQKEVKTVTGAVRVLEFKLKRRTNIFTRMA